jgi:hypothetical protein
MTDVYNLGLAGGCSGHDVGVWFPLTGTGPDLAYLIQTDITCNLEVSLDPDSADLALYVLSPDCIDENGNCIRVDDAGGMGVAEVVSFTSAVDQPYYVIVDGFNGQSGAFDLDISETSGTGCQLVPGMGDIGDWVWYDEDQNGIQNSYEVGLSGVHVRLYECYGDLIDQTDTDSSGNYSFVDVPSGSYNLEFVEDNPDWLLTAKDQGGDDYVDSDADPTTGQTGCFYVAADVVDTRFDAGYYLVGTKSLGGQVWYDTDQDGIDDDISNEPGVENVKVELFDNAACSGSAIDWQNTNADGEYVWHGISTGDRCLRFSNFPSGWQISPQDQGGDDTRDSDVDPATGQISGITLNDHWFDEDVGVYMPGSLGGTVFCDADGDSVLDPGEGKAGFRVDLLWDLGCDANPEAILGSTDTATDGSYLFSNLITGPPDPGQDECYFVAPGPDCTGACCALAGPAWYWHRLDATSPSGLDDRFWYEARTLYFYLPLAPRGWGP